MHTYEAPINNIEMQIQPFAVISDRHGCFYFKWFENEPNVVYIQFISHQHKAINIVEVESTYSANMTTNFYESSISMFHTNIARNIWRSIKQNKTNEISL